ncbi:protein PSY3-like [Neltuma alba]|uniref:protein PSY3-like n=1 Tax=Neltuma alba TaxID=207710 RepID=UPI0010A2CEDE|nr:protein PSY3-like [Prosopis alba]
MALGLGGRYLGLCLLLAFVLVSNARTTLFFSQHDETTEMNVAGRSLKTISLNDYGETRANSRHDPSRRGGRKG